jgi:hypothetical protein
MGILMDTYEDTRDRYADDLNPHIFLRLPKEELPAGMSGLTKCPVCFDTLPEEDFAEHARRRHASQHVYIRLNGHIIRDTGWAEGGIHQCSIILLGMDTTIVTIVTGNRAREVEVKDEASLLPYLPDGWIGEIAIRVTSSAPLGGVVAFTLYSKELPSFRSSEIDEAIIPLQLLLEQQVEPDWKWLRCHWLQDPGYSQLERRYLKGFYAYTLAAWQERLGKFNISHPRLEEAYTFLTPFGTRLASNALGILALRLNAFGYLRECKNWQVLGLAYTFFINGALQPLPHRHAILATRQLNASSGVYIEPFLQTYIEALSAFYVGDDALLARRLSTLADLPLCQEPNNGVKYCLLQARACARAGMRREACHYYMSLVSDPTFGTEAKEYIA